MQADPTRYRGRLVRLGEMSEDDAQPLHLGSGGSTYTRKAHATREAPSVVRSGMTGPTSAARASSNSSSAQNQPQPLYAWFMVGVNSEATSAMKVAVSTPSLPPGVAQPAAGLLEEPAQRGVLWRLAFLQPAARPAPAAIIDAVHPAG